jgi:multicomponent Na+:H+ antiporter subunit D
MSGTAATTLDGLGAAAASLHPLPIAVVLVSLVAGVAIFVIGEERRILRAALNLAAAVAKIALVAWVGALVAAGQEPIARFEFVPGFALVLRADAFSMLFAWLSAGLWLVTTVYAIAYLAGSPNQARFFGFFSICITATMGIAMAGNLLTFFVFYELLTLATWPLVVHDGTRAALRGGRTYLRYTLGGSTVFLLGLIWLYGLAGTGDFLMGGTLGQLGLEPSASLRAIFVMLTVGMGVKAALVPLHAWLPAAMVAPAPVSALLHAVAVVKAGAFGLVRLVVDVYGPAFTAELGMDTFLAVAAAVTIVYGSVMALRQVDLKKRLAYSTVSQVSYIAFGVAIGGALAVTGGVVHLVHQGVMKVTLFFCAGAFAAMLGVHRVDQLDGIGRRMPWSAAAFTVAALGMIGLPPMAGFVSKWYLGVGAVANQQPWAVTVLVASTLLNAAYFLPLVKRLWLVPATPPWPAERRPNRWVAAGLVVPALLTAAASILFGALPESPMSPLTWVIEVVRGFGS